METRGEEVHVDMEEARAGTTPNVVRYVLLVSLTLAIIALSAIWITGALTDDNPEGAATGHSQTSSQDGGVS